jgi:hypothetical protein
MKFAVAFLILCLPIAPLLAQETVFSGDRAYDHVKVFAGEIGPRPMGSPAEKRALDYAVARFKEYGCDESYVMPFTVAGGVNTSSGVAVGVHRGKTGRIIVIGGHIDSSGPNIPGANDDASGSATVLELARIISGRATESTVVFCCWGGEEEGLRGSTYFVSHFPLIDSVALMLQIDMTDGSGHLEVDPDAGHQVSAPSWLVRSAFEIARDELGYTDVVYPTNAATLNASGETSAGSDHEPFLDEGIPAIDFTTDISYPVHTRLDNLATFNPAGLQRSGDIVLKLFERYDGGVPSRSTEKYYLLQYSSLLFFVPHWLLWFLVLVSVAAGTLSVIALIQRRPPKGSLPKIRWSGFKIFTFTVVVQLFVWMSETVVALIRGIRFPWVNNFGGFVVLGVIAGVIGLWVVLRWARRWQVTEDPFPLHLRACILLVLAIALMAFAGAEMAAYPAMVLLLLGLAMLARNRMVRVVLALAAPIPIVRLLFSEWLGILTRALATRPDNGPLPSILFDAGLILLFTLASLPLAYAYVALDRDSASHGRWFSWFASWRGVTVAGALAAGVLVMLVQRPVYSSWWERETRVEQRQSLGADSSIVRVESAEYLRGDTVSWGGRDSVLEGRTNAFVPELPGQTVVRWLQVERTDEEVADSSAADSSATMRRLLLLKSALRPYMVEVSYRTTVHHTVTSSWSAGARRRGLGGPDPNATTFTWYSFPDTILAVPVTISAPVGTKVTESITVTYDTLSYPLRVSGPLTGVAYRTIVTAADTFRVHDGGGSTPHDAQPDASNRETR